MIRVPSLLLAVSFILLASAGRALAQSTYPVPAGKAVIVVKVPAGAAVKIGGQATTQQGTQRIFYTPDLAAGYDYSYAVEATWREGGQERKVIKTVKFKIGQAAVVDLTKTKTVEQPKIVVQPKEKDEPKLVQKPKVVDQPKVVDKTPSLPPIRVLLIDGQNNHNWRATSPFMKKVLEDSGRFIVDVATAPEAPKGPQKPKSDKEEDLAKYKEQLVFFKKAEEAYQTAMAKFTPAFEKYQVVLSNYNGASWPKATEMALDAALKEGKVGLVIVHAANNSFGGWKEYNQMIGMGWRGKKFGDRLKVDEAGQEIRVPAGADLDTGHRYTGPFTIIVRDQSHPITKGMPREWLHAQDELYDNLRGPIQNVRLLATGLAPKGKGTGVQEPMIFTVTYGTGRVFHTPMGHDLNGMRCQGFVTTLLRGTEWAATGAVTQPLPAAFPTADKTSSVK